MSATFPGESAEYRAARDRLLEQEIELRRATEAVAAARRELPPGGVVPEDYVFQGLGQDGAPTDVRLSELFAPGTDSLVVYSFMFPRDPGDERRGSEGGQTALLPLVESPCPSCTALLDQLDGAAEHASQRVNLAVVGPPGARDNVKTDVENLIGGNGTDTLTGSAGSNMLRGGNGADVLSGLAGSDTATYATRTAGVTVDIDGVADDGNVADGPAGARDNVKTDIENLIGGNGADTLTGNDQSNNLNGGPGADALRGLGGNDRLFANDGTADSTIDCDGGTTDVAHVDSFDPTPIGCESVGP